MPPTRKELLLAASVFLAIPIVGEISLRLAGVHFDAQLYAPNRERGWGLRPGASGFVSTETRQLIRINSGGFHDRERAYEKPANTIRIAVLGNSWTEALQVPIEKAYTSVLQQKLNVSPCFAGKRVEVLNFGVAGYSTGQELMTLRQEVWNYHPDFVLLAFYPARDIANNVRELNNAADPERSPYFIEREGQLILDDSFRSLPALQPWQIAQQNLGYRVNQHIRVLQAVNALQHIGKIRVAMAAARQRAKSSRADNLEFAIYAPPSFPAMQTAWHITEGLILAMRDEVTVHGAKFRVVTLATRPQVIPDPAKREETMRQLGVADFSYADRRIKQLGENAGIAVTNLGPPLAAYAEAHHVFLNGFSKSNWGAGHWNETGHQLAGEAIAKDMCRIPDNQAPPSTLSMR